MRGLRVPERPYIARGEAPLSGERGKQGVNVVRGASRRITVLTGNDNFIWESYLLGAEGALLGACAVTTRTHVEVYQAAMRGDWQLARERGDRIQKVVDAVFAPPVRDYRARCKEVLVMQGILKHAHMRPPLTPVGPDSFAGELSSQYRVSFESVAGLKDKDRKLEVKVARPGAKVRIGVPRS